MSQDTTFQAEQALNAAIDWRTRWLCLANRIDRRRLQSTQDRIEYRAGLANARAGRYMKRLDELRAGSLGIGNGQPQTTS